MIRPMAAQDLSSFGLDTLGFTVRAIVAEEDGVPIAAAGVIHTEPPYAFAHIEEPMRKYPKRIMRVIKDFDIFLQSNYDVVYAVADVGEKNAPKVLEKVGFEYHQTNAQGDVYRWHKHPYH